MTKRAGVDALPTPLNYAGWPGDTGARKLAIPTVRPTPKTYQSAAVPRGGGRIPALARTSVMTAAIESTSISVPVNFSRAGTLREFKDMSERAYLVQKLRENGWNISKTAEVIDTPRSNLYKKLEQYQISQESDG